MFLKFWKLCLPDCNLSLSLSLRKRDRGERGKRERERFLNLLRVKVIDAIRPKI